MWPATGRREETSSERIDQPTVRKVEMRTEKGRREEKKYQQVFLGTRGRPLGPFARQVDTSSEVLTFHVSRTWNSRCYGIGKGPVVLIDGIGTRQLDQTPFSHARQTTTADCATTG